jgi:rSAM/selenodomain-associated transferase 2
MLSVVIPTLNAEAVLPKCLAALNAGATDALIGEIIVVDGGSRDGTVAVAGDAGATVLEGRPGRGPQLAAGGAAAKGPWLLFLHADTVLEPGWREAVQAFVVDPDNRQRAAVFAYALDTDSGDARRLESLVAWRNRLLALPYGDQGLLIAKAFYDDIGGFADLPIMEDVDLIQRIGRRRLHHLPVKAVTSAARYERGGYLRRPLRNLACLAGYFIGVSPALIVRIYR